MLTKKEKENKHNEGKVNEKASRSDSFGCSGFQLFWFSVPFRFRRKMSPLPALEAHPALAIIQRILKMYSTIRIKPETWSPM